MQFGIRKADAPPAQGRSPISWFGKEDTRLRFLEEVDNWTKIFQHFSNSSRSSYPCTGEIDTCPGCNSDDEREAKASCRFIANAVDVARGYANLYSVPVSLISQLERYSDKDGGTIMARDYTVVQYKEDGFTKYAVEKEEREKINLDKFELKDHQNALNEQYAMVWGKNDSPAAQERASTKETKTPVEPVKEQDEVKDEEPPKSKRMPAGARAPKNMREVAQAKESEDPPSEPQQEDDAAEEETLTMTEEQIRAMSLEDLLALYNQCGIEWDPDEAEPAQFLIDSLS